MVISKLKLGQSAIFGYKNATFNIPSLADEVLDDLKNELLTDHRNHLNDDINSDGRNFGSKARDAKTQKIMTNEEVQDNTPIDPSDENMD